MIITKYHQTYKSNRKFFAFWKNPGYEKPGSTYYIWLFRRWLIAITPKG